MKSDFLDRPVWKEIDFNAELIGTGLCRVGRARPENPWLSPRSKRLRGGEIRLTVGREDVRLYHDDVEMLRLPFRSLRGVDFISFSIADQIRRALVETGRNMAWTGGAKTAIAIYAVFAFALDPWSYLESWPQFLGTMLAMGLILHLPLSFFPSLWRIDGRIWRMCLRTVDLPPLHLLVVNETRQELMQVLKMARVVTSVEPWKKTWLDRSWPGILENRARINDFLVDMFDIGSPSSNSRRPPAS